MNIQLTEGEFGALVPMTECDDLRAVVEMLGVMLLDATGSTCVESTSPHALKFCNGCPLSREMNRKAQGREHLAELFCTKDQRYDEDSK